VTAKSALLLHPPAESELQRAYYELALIGAPSAGSRRRWPYRPESQEELIALAGEMLRYDPRLLTILLQLTLVRWEDLNPTVLRRIMMDMRWPQALLVVFTFARGASNDPELRYFVDYLSSGWPRVEPAERFFLDAERPGSRTAERRLGRNLRAYARWGFIGTERPVVDSVTRLTVGRYDALTRRRILEQLIARRTQFTLAEYLESVDHTVSRQQATLDLGAHPDLRLAGRGRGARWRAKRRKPAG